MTQDIHRHTSNLGRHQDKALYRHQKPGSQNVDVSRPDQTSEELHLSQNSEVHSIQVPMENSPRIQQGRQKAKIRERRSGWNLAMKTNNRQTSVGSFTHKTLTLAVLDSQ